MEKTYKWYVVTVWNGKGSGEKMPATTDYNKAMSLRRHTKTLEQTEYTVADLYRNDIECTTLDVYNLKPGEWLADREPVLSLTWY